MPIIYHYTSQEGFLGILESGELHCSDIYSLNDAKEMHHSLDGLKSLLHERKDAAKDDVLALAFYDACAERLDWVTTAGHRYYYVACFSHVHPDRLSQWHAYGWSVPGYCLGFDQEAFEKVATTDPDLGLMDCWAGDVTYNLNGLRAVDWSA